MLQRGKELLTKPRQEFLISLLFATDRVEYHSKNWGDKPAGTRRVNDRAKPMIDALRKMGLVEWEYAKVYSTRNLYDARLTMAGYHWAARCLLWEHCEEIEAYPPTMPPNTLNRPSIRATVTQESWTKVVPVEAHP